MCGAPMFRASAFIAFGLVASVGWAQQPAPAGVKVMVPDVAVPPSVAKQLQVEPGQLATLLAGAVVQSAKMQATTMADVKALLEQGARTQLLGCNELSCAMDVSRIAQADLLLRGEVGFVAGRVLVSTTLINVKDARVTNIVTRSMTPEQLAGGGMETLVQSLFSAATTPEEPVRLASATEQGVKERLVVTAGPWADQVADAAGRRAGLSRAAEAVSKLQWFDVISTEELKGAVANEVELQSLGEGNPEVFGRVAEKLKAKYLLTVDAGRTAEAYVVAASLLDSQSLQVVNRSSLVFREGKQLMDAIDVATRRVFGQHAALAPPDADPNGVEAALKSLSASVSSTYNDKLPQGGASGLVILPFGETGDAKTRKLGTHLATFMHHLMGQPAGTSVAPATKVRELAKSHDVNDPMSLAPNALQEMGMFLGAQALVVGSVGDLGTDYLLQAKLVKVAGGEPIWTGHVMIPKAKPGQLLPKRAVVTRSRADALTRAVVPGLAQFTSGPMGILKGAVFVGVIVVGLGVVVPAIATAVFGALLSFANTSSSAGVNDIPMLTRTWPLAPGEFGSDHSCASENSPASNPGYCEQPRMAGVGIAAIGGALIAGGLATGVLAYVLSFVDAALFGERSEELDFEAVTQ